MGSRGYTVYLHNDVTGELKEMRVLAKSKYDAMEIAIARTSVEWVVDSVTLTV